MAVDDHIVVLVGGVGGAKLALGLSHILPPEKLTIVVNTGDDFWHLGLRVCPDMDTVIYTLADIVNPEFGWGVNGDTRTTLETLSKHYGFEPWFGLGDKDIATHLLRTHLLREGKSLTDIMQILTTKLGIKHPILPMTDAEVPTIVNTEEFGELGFQEYFVKHRWQPTVKSLHFRNIEQASIPEKVYHAIKSATAILIAPSNPWLSIAPILSVPGMRDLIVSADVPRVVVTPIIGGKAVKGPAAKIMGEMGLDVTAQAVLNYYGNVVNGFVDDLQNPEFAKDSVKIVRIDTLMKDLSDKIEVAKNILSWIGGWGV